jgi:hypothetical protein
LRSRVEDLGRGIDGSGLDIEGLRFRVGCLRFRTLGLGLEF